MVNGQLGTTHMLDPVTLQTVKRNSSMLSRKTNGVITAPEIGSFLYDIHLKEAFEKLTKSQQCIIAGETGGVCLHAKVNKNLAVFCGLFDIDFDKTTATNSIRVSELIHLGTEIHNALVLMLKILDCESSGSDECSYMEFHKSNIFVESTRVYMYYSINKGLQQRQRKSNVDDGQLHYNWPYDKTHEGEALSPLEKRILRGLNKRLPTKSVRVFVEFPPNVIFKDVSVFNEYMQRLKYLINPSIAYSLTSRLTTHGELFDLKINHGMCRLPLSPKFNNEECLNFMPLVLLPSQLDSHEFVSQYIVDAALDKTKGFIHLDPYPGILDGGMLIKGFSIFTDRHYSKSLMFQMQLQNEETIACVVKNKLKEVTDMDDDGRINQFILRRLCDELQRLNCVPLEKTNSIGLDDMLMLLRSSRLQDNKGKMRGYSMDNVNYLRLDLVGGNRKNMDRCLLVNHRKNDNRICEAHLRINTMLKISLYYHCFNCGGGKGKFDYIFSFSL
jgi:hypothetical protein